MNILFTSSELAPYAKTGGLGDVMASLPAALQKRGHHVSFVIPLYANIRQRFKDIKKTSLELSVPMGANQLAVPVWEGKTPEGMTVFALQRDEFYDRSNLYGNEYGDYLDNLARYAFFSRAVVELAKFIEPQTDIIHCNDWHTALVPAYVRAWSMPFNTVLTIHNLAYQGSFPGWTFADLDLPSEYFSPAGVEFYGRVNFLKAGVLLSHAVTTVSPTYAKEIQTETYGFGLHDVLKANNYKLTGILNGMCADMWNPKTDDLVAKNYDAKNLAGKADCKKALLKTLKFSVADDTPLFGMITRFASQKGIDLLTTTMSDLLKKGVRLVILGTGDPVYEQTLARLAKKHPKQLAIRNKFDEEFAHKIQAGCDFFLMPSQYEPSGLTQLYALRYGTIPIVRNTGGLADSVIEWDNVVGTGFKFNDYTAPAFLEKIDAALALYQDKPHLQKIRQNAMQQDFSWQTRIQDYEKFYKTLPAVKK